MSTAIEKRIPRLAIVAGFSSQPLAEEIAAELGSRVVTVTRKQFNDKEIQTTIEENVRGLDVVVIASASGDPNKQEKEARLRGFYIHPELHGALPEKQLEWARHPELMKRIKDHRNDNPAVRRPAVQRHDVQAAK